MSFPEFGPFAPVFESSGPDAPHYLTLLHFPNDAQIALDRIVEALRATEAQKWVAALFADINWRPHLVGAAAILLDQRTRLDATPLWSAIDAGSWVTPQLIVTAFFSDPAFAARAHDRMNSGCPVRIPPGLDPLARHVAAGPAGPFGRSGKMAASILAISSRVPSLAARENIWREDSQLCPLLEEDRQWDGSEEITNGWLAAVVDHFLKRGIALSAPPS